MYVTTAGSATIYNANSVYGARPDCISSSSEVSAEYAPAETTNKIKEHTTCLPPVGGKPSAGTEASADATYKTSLFSSNIIFTEENLIWAARQCLKGSRWKNSVAQWELNLVSNCVRLARDIRTGRYRMGKGHSFEITHPKRRTVTSMLFRDRVVHKVICHQGHLIEDCFRNTFLDNTACQKGKGTAFAIARLRTHLRRYYTKHGSDGYVISLDVRKFFDSIPHDTLIEFIYQRVRSPLIRKMVSDIVSSYAGEKGIGLGSEVSQVLANAYLTSVDFYIKQRLGISYYVRYADNLILLLPVEVPCIMPDGSSSSMSGCTAASMIAPQIGKLLKQLGLDINPKSAIYPMRNGINFLGFRFRLTASGTIRQRVLSSSVRCMRRHLGSLSVLYKKGTRTAMQVIEAFKSWAAYARGGMSDYRIKELYDQLLEVLRYEH